ncbi:hypothetical protein A1OO_22500 [Enterovibrio norvegicus FF-33]|uniref:hypothetical protein n=1 Tax=Enterovibrio norvegicus TaxID=188144 RepID=UPI0002FB862C|nr:hypothetical protein [Enterovibrio norvegicus]OEE70993.1 hypothetical protein A1OO_22500 [Enterovibrio norvegicus FF-33]
MKNSSYSRTLVLVSLSLASPSLLALEGDDALQDMSDPLAVYTQGGVGITDQGLNFKLGMAYDTGNPDTMAMNILELKGFAGDLLHLDGNDSFDALRYRHFSLDTTTGRGSQLDVNWDFESDLGSASYSFMQALPAMGDLQLYPLAGAGLTVTDTAEIRGTENPVGSVGYAIPSTYMVVGTYAKYSINENIWLNYNPMYINTLNSNHYMADLMDGWHHEAAASYQLNPRQNVRLFANYSDSAGTSSSVEWRLEFNHQF